jgi:hypothetical protein
MNIGQTYVGAASGRRQEMKMEHACAAVASGHRQEWHYNGYARTLEVQACGVKDGNVVARVWQVSGGEDYRQPGWDLVTLKDAHVIRELAALCDAPLDGYSQPDLKLDITFFCQKKRPPNPSSMFEAA